MDDTVRAALALASRGLQQGEQLRLRVSGDSMAPLLHAGDYVTVGYSHPDEFRRGDLALIRRENDLVTHRLIGRSALGWLAKGDGSPWADPPVHETSLLGKVIALESGGRHISFDARSWGMRSQMAGWLGWVEHRLWGWLKPLQTSMEGRLGTVLRLARTPFWAAYTIIAAIDRRSYDDIGHVPHPRE
jgi:hypothetical protein